MSYMPKKLLEKKLLQFLQEDLDYGDITSDLVPNIPVKADLSSKQEGIVCGLDFTKILLESLGIKVSTSFKDGDTITEGDVILQLIGNSREILTSERTILNLLMRLSGVATQTKNLTKKVKQSGKDIKIASTRKTTPGFRYFEKYAVRIGKGDPHRWNLSDSIIIKENHLKLLGEDAISAILSQSRNKASFTKKIEIEVENIEELKTALKLSPDIIMLDDFTIEDIKEAIKIIKQSPIQNHPLIEVSGGISERNIDKFLISGIDIISIGALTHSAKSIDFSLKLRR